VNHVIRIAQSEISFDCAEGESLLDGAARHGIELPYSCRKGICGNCAGHVLQGQVAGIDGAALRNEACLPEQLLFCVCSPTSDLEIEPASWRRIDPAARKKFKAKVFRNTLAAPDVSILQLRLPAGQRAKFKAGQYLQIEVGDGSRRSYSMANAPHESDSVTLHIRQLPGGAFSTRVPQLQPGELVEIELPFGAFSLQEDSARPIVFVAGGTGFAPVRSIIDDMLKRRIERPITLVWGARRADGIYLRQAVAAWQKRWPDFRFIPALSEAGADADADGGIFAGRADEALMAHCPELSGHELYCCGAPPMVAAVRDAAVHRAGLAPVDFHSDVFVDGPAASIQQEAGT
jgi:NAD(P)H-flavin reductase/ferredoxin